MTCYFITHTGISTRHAAILIAIFSKKAGDTLCQIKQRQALYVYMSEGLILEFPQAMLKFPTQLYPYRPFEQSRNDKYTCLFKKDLSIRSSYYFENTTLE